VLFPLFFLMLESDADRQFFEDLYTEHHRLMYAQALQITHDSSAAEDVISDSLMALMKKIDLLRTLPCNKLRSYVVITVKHHAINHFNRQKREQPIDDAKIVDLSAEERVEDQLMDAVGVERIKDAIAALPPREKDIMMMRYFRELTDEEIGAEMGIRPVSVRVHLSRARNHLAQLLSGKEGNWE